MRSEHAGAEGTPDPHCLGKGVALEAAKGETKGNGRAFQAWGPAWTHGDA